MPADTSSEPTSRRFPAIVLAAGRSSRFTGGHKLLAEVAGVPLVRRVLDAVAGSPVHDIAVVVAADGTAVRAAAGEGRWRFVVNDHAHDGLSTSIRAGLAALAPDTSGVLIVLADMPGVSEDLIARVLDAASAGTTRIVHPVTADGQQGHPVFWPSDLFAELMSLQGDAGAKSILARHKHRVVTISPGAADAFSDIDTPGDLAAFVAGRNRDT